MSTLTKQHLYVDILKDRRNTSDINWAMRDWNPAVAFKRKKKLRPNDIKSLVKSSLPVILELTGQTPTLMVLDNASQILNEMGYNREMTVLRMLAAVTAKLLKILCRGIFVNETTLLSLKADMGNSPVLFVPTHRSYADFILFSYVCFHYELDIPRIAAGMDFQGMAIMSRILRDACAFFMRRSFTNDQLYATVFNVYVQALVTHGDGAIEFFIEGTRSRSGKSLFPKFGLLHTTLKPFLTGQVHDMTIIPVGISFDRVLEETLFAYEVLGIPKPKETTKAFFKAAQILKEDYGNVFFTFGRGISARQYFENKLDRKEHCYGPVYLQNLLPHEISCIKQFGHTIIQQQKSLIVVNCFNVIAAVVNNYLVSLKYSFDVDSLVQDVNWLASILEKLGANIIANWDENTIKEYIKLHKTLLFSSKNGIKLKKAQTSAKTSIVLKDSTINNSTPMIMLQHYANPIAHYLIPLSFHVGILKAHHNETMDVDYFNAFYAFLKQIFLYEFVWDDSLSENICQKFEKFDACVITNNDKVSLAHNINLIKFSLTFLASFVPGYLLLVNILLAHISTNNPKPITDHYLLSVYQQQVEKKLNANEICHPYNLSKDLMNNALMGFIRFNAVKKIKPSGQYEYVPNQDKLDEIFSRLNLLNNIIPKKSLNYDLLYDISVCSKFFGSLGTVVRRPGVSDSNSQQRVSARIPPPSAKNVQLVEELRRRATARIAQNLKRKSIRTRLGIRGGLTGLRSSLPVTGGIFRSAGSRMALRPLNVQARLGISLRGRGRARGRLANVQSLKRSASVQSLTGVAQVARGRSRSRGRNDRSLSRKRQMSRSRSRGPQGTAGGALRRSRSRSRINQQVRARSRSRSRGALNGAGGSRGEFRRGRPRGRGRGGTARGAASAGTTTRARSRSRSRTRPAFARMQGGRGGRGGRGRMQPPPSKDELDKQLDQYMSGGKENNGETPVKPSAMDITWP